MTLPLAGTCARCGAHVLPDGILGLTPEVKGQYIQELGSIPNYFGQEIPGGVVCAECCRSDPELSIGHDDSMQISDRNPGGFKC